MQIPVEAVIGGATVIGGAVLVLHRVGLFSFGKNGKSTGVPEEACRRNHDELAKELRERDEKYEEILHANHTTQELMLQRMEQTEERLNEGNRNFGKLYDITQAQNTSIALLNQSMQQQDQRLRKIEAKTNGNSH